VGGTMKLTKMIYLASAYSCMDEDATDEIKQITRDYRYDEVTKCAAALHDKYPYAFILPITQSHHTAKYRKNVDTGFAAWERIDLTFVSRCDELWVLDMAGWKESVGVQAEIAFAVANGIPVRIVQHGTNKVKKLKLIEDAK